MKVLLFEDRFVSQLQPICNARPAYAITCGGYRVVDFVRRLGNPMVGRVRSYLARIQSQEFDIPFTNRRADETLWLNARLVPSVANFDCLQAWIASNQFGVVRNGDVLLAARIRSGEEPHLLSVGLYNEFASQGGTRGLPECEVPLELFRYPHDVIRWNESTIVANLIDRIRRGAYFQIEPGVWIAEDVNISDPVRFDTTNGPVVVDRGTSILPFAYLKGPLYLGPNVRINEHASIKNGTVVSANCKVGGEIDSSILEPFSNKQHYGFLGNSYLGSWVNLGAGTSNSNLKNTYGTVKINCPKLDSGGESSDTSVDTGMTFVGCFVGDYSKTAINTSIFTGKRIGVCSTVYGVVTADVGSFVNDARSLGDVTAMSLDVMLSTQARVFARRGRKPTEADMQLLHDLHDAYAVADSELAVRPLSL